MKFVSAIIALVAALAIGSEAAKPKNKQEWKRELNQRMKNGQFDKATIMKKAKPHSDAAKQRALDGLEITGSYSVQFVSCFSFTTSYEDMFEGNDDGSMVMSLFSQGNIMALDSYAIFRLCYGGDCNANGNASLLEYVIDLSTYVQAMVTYLPAQMEGFCEACQENYDNCMSQMYGQYASAYQNGNNQAYNYQTYIANDNNYNGNNVNSVNNGNYQNGYDAYGNANGQQQTTYSNGYNANGQQQQQQAYNSYNSNNGNNANGQQQANSNGNYRKLADLHEFEHRVLNNGQVVKQLDCQLCQEYNCLDDNENGQDDVYGFEAASEWLSDIAECSETGVAYGGSNGGYYNNNDQGGDGGVYAGMICNGDGSGVEIGLFYDEDCSLYLPNEAYSNYMSYFDQTYQQMTKEIIEFTFSNAIFSCKDEEVVYTTQNINGYNNQYGGNYNWNDNGDDDDVAEWCEMLLEGESEPVDMDSCGANQYAYGNNNGNANGNYYSSYNEKYDNWNENYQQGDQSNQYQYNYDWYRYEITAENSIDMIEVCKVAKKSGGALHTFYNTNNGNMYSYANSNSASDTITEFMEDTENVVQFSWMATANNLSGGAKFGIVAGTGILVGAVVALFLRFRASAEDDKNVGLMEDEELDDAPTDLKGEVA